MRVVAAGPAPTFRNTETQDIPDNTNIQDKFGT